MNIVLYVVISVLCINLILSLYRFVKGPVMPDRIVALDVFSGNLLAILALYALVSGIREFIDIAVLFSLIAFAGTMTFAYYLVRTGKKKD
jgi:multicomponent Na+:H+ antiporter subunit F